MRKQYQQHLRQQSKVIAHVATQQHEITTRRLMVVGVAVAAIAYLFGFFFSSAGGRAPADT
jgi:uncharacterized membrane protein YukC